MLFKDVKLKNIILLALTLVIFFIVVELSVTLYILLFIPKTLALIHDKSLLNSTIRNPDRGGDLKFYEYWVKERDDHNRRFEIKKVHLKHINVSDDNYLDNRTNFSSYHWEIGFGDLKGFSENYFSGDNIIFLKKKNFLYIDQSPLMCYSWQLCRSNAKLTLSTVLLLVNSMLGSYKIAVYFIAMSWPIWLLASLISHLSFNINCLVLLLQVIAKVCVLISSISGEWVQTPEEDTRFTPPTWPASTYYTRRFANCYEYRPLVLVEYENYPHWLVYYLLLPKPLKDLEDRKFLDEDSSIDTWLNYVRFNSLSSVRSDINKSLFTCPYGNTYQFLIKRDYLNSALLYLNFSLVPLISLRIKIKSMIYFKVFLRGKPLK